MSAVSPHELPGPYGASIPFVVGDVDGAPCPLITPIGVARMLGVHGDDRQRQFANELGFAARAQGDFAPLRAKFNCRVVVQVPLPRPAKAYYLSIADRPAARVVDRLVPPVRAASSWAARSGVLLAFLEDQLRVIGKEEPVTGCVAMHGLVTGALEHLGETEITCIEAAAFYALSLHREWRRAGQDWLLFVKDTWARDWIAARPIYRQNAQLLRRVCPDVPSWLGD